MKVNLIDCTLREGNQAPGVQFNELQSISIAKLLANAQVDMIEIGHPFASDVEFARVKHVVGLALPIPILAHARAKIEDIDAVFASGASWIGIFLGVNETSQKYRLQRSYEELLSMVTMSVRHAKSLGLRVRYTVEDTSRTPISLAIPAYEAALREGADRICFADTLGIMEPKQTSEYIHLLQTEFPAAKIEVHFHNDRALAMANTLAAIDAGSTWISSSVNGMGERSGITDTCILIANLYYRQMRELPTSLTLKELSQEVASITHYEIPLFHPVTGKNAFVHSSRLHQRAVHKDAKTYEWLQPALLGKP